MLIKSKVKYIQSLGQKKLRNDAELFVAEGPKLASELLGAANVAIHEVYALKDWIESNRSLLKDKNVTEVSSDELRKISQLSTPNQVLLLIKKFDIIPVEAKGRLTLVLDGIQDPGNLGTIVRIADWFSISQIVCSMDCADRYNPKVVQSTMGSIARVNLFYTDIAAWLENQKEIRSFAATLEAKDVRALGKIDSGIIVIGNESKGISRPVLDRVQEQITIKGRGGAESLNAAVATGIILSHLT
jgi:RNA methyltransferase, TrmH family